MFRQTDSQPPTTGTRPSITSQRQVISVNAWPELTLSRVGSNPGRPLDPGTHVVMESRFGYDFSQVRVHTNQSPEASIFRKAARKPKTKLLLDLPNALLHVLEDEKTTRSMMVVFGKATQYLLRSGHDFRISQWFERYTTPTRTDYTACTWFPWGRELDRFPEDGKVGFMTIKGRLHPIEKQGGRGIVYKAISPAKKAQYQKMERDFKAGKIKWEELAEYKLLKWEIHTDDISQYCNPFGKYATVIHGSYMLHGTDGEDGDVHPFQALTLEGRKDISHGCVRTSNTDIDWLKNNVPGNTRIHILGEGKIRR